MTTFVIQCEKVKGNLMPMFDFCFEAIQAINYQNWFHGNDITIELIHYVEELYLCDCFCPKCQENFTISPSSSFKESNEFPKFYEQCLHKKTTWA